VVPVHTEQEKKSGEGYSEIDHILNDHEASKKEIAEHDEAIPHRSETKRKKINTKEKEKVIVRERPVFDPHQQHADLYDPTLCRDVIE
jgi:hypothetical protein